MRSIRPRGASRQGLLRNGSPVHRDRPLRLGAEEYSDDRRNRRLRAFYRQMFGFEQVEIGVGIAAGPAVVSRCSGHGCSESQTALYRLLPTARANADRTKER